MALPLRSQDDGRALHAVAAMQARPVSLAGEQLLPVAASLTALLPGGGLRRGTTVVVSGSTSLALALVAEASAAGSWCAAVAMPALGLAAAGEAGIELARLALVPRPGPQWPQVVATLVDAFDMVLLRPPARLRPADARRLSSRARERGAVLVATGSWPGADLRLSIASSQWEGLGQGHGHLRGRQVEVVADGRGAAAIERRAAVGM